MTDQDDKPGRVLVAFGTKYGSTAEIAEAIGKALGEAGLDVDVQRAREVKTLEPYTAVVIGSAVYMRRWRREAVRLLRRHRRELADRRLWLFSSGPVGEQDDEDEEKAERRARPKLVEDFVLEVGAREHVMFGGCVSPDEGGLIRKRIAKKTPPELRDRRDWDEIGGWAERIAAELKGEDDE